MVMAILEALQTYPGPYQKISVVDSNLSNAVSWVSHSETRLWELQFYFNKIRQLPSHVHTVFPYLVSFTNSMAYTLAKQGNARVVLWIASIMWVF